MKFFTHQVIWAVLFIVIGINFLVTGAVAYGYFFGLNKWQLAARLPASVRQAGKAVVGGIREIPYLPYLFKEHNLPVYELSIKSEDLAEMNARLPDPFAETFEKFITDEQKIRRSATITINGEEFEANVGYRGLYSDHWLWPKKSWRLNLKKKSKSLGAQKIDLFVPNTRGYVVEAFNNWRARKLGLPVPEDSFIWLRVNGVEQGPYYRVDAWNDEFLKKNSLLGRLYADEGIGTPLFDIFERTLARWKDVGKAETDRENFAPLARFLDFVNLPQAEFVRQTPDFLDVEKISAWYLQALLAGSHHQDGEHNSRLFYDAARSKFYFLPVDVDLVPLSDKHLFFDFHPVITRLLADPVFLLGFERLAWAYVNDPAILQQDLEAYDKLFEPLRPALAQDRSDRFTTGEIFAKLNEYRTILEDNFKLLKQHLSRAVITTTVETISSNRAGELDFKITSQLESSAFLSWEGMRFSELPAGNSEWPVYEDKNANGRRDQEDAIIATMKYDSKSKVWQALFVLPVNPEFGGLTADRQENAARIPTFDPLKPQPVYRTLVVESNLPKIGRFSDFKISVQIKNIITGADLSGQQIYYLDQR